MKMATVRLENAGSRLCYQVRYLEFAIGGPFTADEWGKASARSLRTRFNRAIRQQIAEVNAKARARKAGS